MNRSIWIVICSLLFLMRFGGLCCHQIQKKISSPVLNSMSISKALEIYWNASFSGNSDIVKQLSALPPEDYLQECIGEKKSDAIENEFKVQKEELDKDISNSDSAFIEKKLKENLFNDKSVPFDVIEMSDYIYTSKTSFQKMKITEQKVFNDEALIYLIEADYKGSYENASKLIFFLKKESEIWKIISIVDSVPPSTLWDKISYAVPKPQCR
jgi:hypothetical protein